MNENSLFFIDRLTNKFISLNKMITNNLFLVVSNRNMQIVKVIAINWF